MTLAKGQARSHQRAFLAISLTYGHTAVQQNEVMVQISFRKAVRVTAITQPMGAEFKAAIHGKYPNVQHTPSNGGHLRAKAIAARQCTKL